MAEKFTRWDAADHLKTEEDIMAYFEACLNDDPGDIAKARNMTRLAEDTRHHMQPHHSNHF